jgi:hypothetical protein
MKDLETDPNVVDTDREIGSSSSEVKMETD